MLPQLSLAAANTTFETQIRLLTAHKKLLSTELSEMMDIKENVNLITGLLGNRAIN